MSALLRYHLALLLRSQRWLPPVFLYVALLAIGVRPGQPVLDSLGYTAGCLLPVAAWSVRICVTGEPPAARICVAAPAGPARAHLAALLTAFLTSAVVGAVAALLVTAISEPASGDHQVHVPRVPAGAAGLLGMLACVLLGTAAGAVTSRPLLRSRGHAVPALVLAVILALVLPGSPARAALTDLVTGSQDGVVHAPLLPCATGALVALAATALACALCSRRD
ncbi:ABC transporter [Streptomyces odontomachi]|uniref:ABC transporter n=1 Tax=Streptomyces odontomachi TaxID=2944940 RepID=UPI00210CBD88|nr:ABC transporter [Streptomyces sp. ODS25]